MVLSDFDRTHRLAISYRYDLPFFQSAEGWKRKALGGWAVAGITIVQSGLPFSVIDSGAGTAFLGAGSAPGVTGGSLASGATMSSGYSQRRHRHARQRILESGGVHDGAVAVSGAMRSEPA